MASLGAYGLMGLDQLVAQRKAEQLAAQSRQDKLAQQAADLKLRQSAEGRLAAEQASRLATEQSARDTAALTRGVSQGNLMEPGQEIATPQIEQTLQPTGTVVPGGGLPSRDTSGAAPLPGAPDQQSFLKTTTSVGPGATFRGFPGQIQQQREEAAAKAFSTDPNAPPGVRESGMLRTMGVKTSTAGAYSKPAKGPETKLVGGYLFQRDPDTDTWTKVAEGRPPVPKATGPKASDFQIVQSGDRYVRINKATGDAAPTTVPLGQTAATRTMGEGAQMLQPHIVELGQQAQALDKAGLFGPAMSRIRNAAAAAGSVDELASFLSSDPGIQEDPAVGEFATSLGLMATGAARVHGGARGGGSPVMLEHFKKLLSDSSTAAMFGGRLKALDSYMSGYAAGPGAKTPAGGTTPQGETPDQRLQRLKQIAGIQ